MKKFIYSLLALFSFPAFAYNDDARVSLGCLFLILILILILILLVLPTEIAQKRGVSKEHRRYIIVLSLLGLLFGVTWVVALILAFVFPSENEKKENEKDNLVKLSMLGKLKKDGVLTDEEFEEEKHKLLGG